MAATPGWTALRPERFEGQIEGRRTALYTLRNRNGVCVRFTNLGAKVLQILAPDREGRLGDVALGYDSLQGVLNGQPSMGAFVGRFANRIARGRLTLDGVPHQMPVNSNGHTLHGGPRGSRHRVFEVVRADDAGVEMAMQYRMAEDGFPANLGSRVIYELSDRDELVIRYEAETDGPTVVNMTSHVFFNLAGAGRAGSESLLNHELRIDAAHYTPVTRDQIPTGEIAAVEDTPFDFRRPRRIGDGLAQACDRHEPGTGYDHNWVLDKPHGALGPAAWLHEPASGRTLEVSSTEPGLQFYSGNAFTGQVPRDLGKEGRIYQARSGLCLEPAHFPDSPNQPHFPSTVLRPGQRYSGTTIYRFGQAAKPVA